MSQDYLGLFDTPPDRQQVRLGLVIGGLFAAFLLLLPVRDVPLDEIDGFVPMIDAIVFPSELIAAAMLYAQAAVFRSRALTVLGTVYVYTALLLIPHALTFPGAFAGSGLLSSGVNSASWIVIFRQAAFPVAGLLYVALKQADLAAPPGTRPSAGIALGVVAAILLAVAVTILTTSGHALLPRFFVNRADAIQPYAAAYESVVFALFILATAVLFLKRSSVLDIWLLVAFCGFMIQILMIMSLHSRFTVGWYGVYVLMLFSYLVVTLALIAESNRLYARLARSTAAREREREARLMSLDALVAAIAHEVGQPLTAISIHARTGRNRLTRERPDVGRAIYSLDAIIDAGHRTSEVIKSIRAMFGKRPGVTTEFSLNDLARTTVSLLDRELVGGKIAIEFALDMALPPVRADQAQMQRVLVNLLTNAIEAVQSTQGRPRRIAIRSASPDGQAVVLEVSDNGVGIPSEQMGEVFEAYFTTKATGAGLGLWLCRTMVEAHGGALWASQNPAHGATFHLQLPSSGMPAAEHGS